MAPRKRSRDVDDVDGEIETESASSSFRQQPLHKRSRVSLAHANGGSVVSDDDDDEDDVEESGFMDRDLHHSDMHDYGEVEDEDDEFDDIQATQIIQKQIREHRDNQASEEGVIEEVFCRNFMCHSKLRIKLGPLINFIIGHNGSGKSAVLTALTTCLGGSALKSNRAKKIKDFIKHGEESCTLAVKIKNQGESAYKPELFGRSIIVERSFSRNGGSGFKIKNAEDKTISTKKADLDDILDYFAFQLDNPINVLSQDMARQFLSGSTPADKYKFFIRGTQLEVLDRDYSLIEESLDNVERKLESRQADINVLKQKMDEAERKKKQAEATERIQDKITELNMQHAWAQVQEQEDILQNNEQSVQDAQQNVQHKETAAEEQSDTFDQCDQSYEAAKSAHEESQTGQEPLRQKRDADKGMFDANKKELEEVRAQQRHIKDSMRTSKTTIETIQKSITEEKGRLAGAQGVEHANRMTRLEELKQAAQDASRNQVEHGKGVAEPQRKRDAAFKEYEDAKPMLQQSKDNVKKVESQIKRMRDERPQPYAGYRQNMAQLVRAVDQETRWRSKPVGPMGKHIVLLQQKWSSQIEKTLGAGLDSFVVTNQDDKKLFFDIKRRVGCEAGVILGDPTPLDTTGKEPQQDVDTILRVLRIESDLVRNQLIIQNGIDQTVLIEDRRQAQDFANASPRPQSVKATICMGNDRRAGLRYDFSRTGAQRSSPISIWEGDGRMQSDREDQISALQGHLRHAQQELHTAEQRNRELQNAAESAKKEIVRFDRQQKELKMKAQTAEDAVEAMQAEIDNNRPEDGKLQELENQLAEAKQDRVKDESTYTDACNSIDDLNTRAKELKRDLDAAQAEVDQIEAKVKKASKQVERTDQARTEALHEKNLRLGLVTGAQEELAKITDKRDTQQDTVDEFVRMAGQICGRIAIPPGTTCQRIQNQIDKLSDDMKRRQAQIGGSRQELIKAFQDARLDFSNARNQMETMEAVGKSLKGTLANRHMRWKKFRQFISTRARITFNYLLSERQFRGNAHIDHTNKELDISVEPDLTKVSDKGRQTKTLSGGEKSFSTICLLLSIWEAMGSPIRCLDEFDVFMDSVNRATSMSMMIEAARRSVGRQFILITPQSMNSVVMGDDVKVHKMSDPERGQQALPFE